MSAAKSMWTPRVKKLTLLMGLIALSSFSLRAEEPGQPAGAAGPHVAKKLVLNDEAGQAKEDIFDFLLQRTCYINYPAADGSVWQGTGWILDVDRRLIVTNHHVVDTPTGNVNAVYPIFADGEVIHEIDLYRDPSVRVPAKVIWTDKQRDLGLIQVEKLPKDAMALVLAEKSPKEGARLHSIGGQPRGSEGMWIYTTGNVRGVYRRNLANGGAARVVETQMPLNQGNSGGPIVDDSGQLVAVFEGLRLDAQLVNMCIDIREVRAFLDEALPLVEPKTAELLNRRGDNHYNFGRYDMAMRDYSDAFKLDPKFATAVANRGFVFYQKGDLQTALSEFNDALKRDPEMVNGYYGRALVKRSLEKYPESVEDLTEAIRRSPEEPTYMVERGITYYWNSDYQAALADYDRAIAKDPNMAMAHANRCDVLTQLGRYDEAIKAIDLATGLDPKAEYFNIAGNCLYAQEQYDKAVILYGAAIQRDTKKAMYWHNRGDAHRKLKQYDDAVKDLNAAIQLEPTSDQFANGLGLTFFEAGRYDLAAQAFSTAVKLNGKEAIYYRNRADSNLQIENYSQAATDLTQAIALAEDPESHVMRGQAYQGLGKIDAARVDYERAVELDPAKYQYCHTKYLQLNNQSSEQIRIFLMYYTRTTDGSWHWYPASPSTAEGRKQALNYVFNAGDTYYLNDEDWKVHASRVRLWAKGVESGIVWPLYEEQDLILAPEGGYISESGRQTYEYSFTN